MRVLLPLPDRDFDVTEVAVPWAILRDAGHQVVFATEKAGTVPAADPRLLTGVLFGQLGAAAEARKLYYELIGTPEFGSTVAWADLDPAGFDGLILPGGHAPGMRQYLGSPVLSEQVGRFWRLNRPVGAICHGVLVLARTRDPDTGLSTPITATSPRGLPRPRCISAPRSCVPAVTSVARSRSRELCRPSPAPARISVAIYGLPCNNHGKPYIWRR